MLDSVKNVGVPHPVSPRFCQSHSMPSPEGPPAEYVDFDLHGLVRIRLLDASERDVAVVERQVGPIRTQVPGKPDITIRFVDAIEDAEPLRLLGVRDAGFSAQDFYVLRGKQKSSVKVRFPVDRIGSDSMEIVCERGLPAVPHLIAVINLTALDRGVLPMHASAFLYEGMGVLVTGWAKGGKTETLLAFASEGAEYVGDEWIYLTRERRMLGIPEPIRVWDWQLAELPRFRSAAGPGARAQLAGLRAAARGVGALAKGGNRVARFANRILALIESQRYTHLEPAQLFGGTSGPLEAPLDKILFVASHADPANTITRLSSRKVAERMVFSLLEERSELVSLYHKFRFAFPDRRNALLDRIEEVQRTLMDDVLSGVDALEVLHPYPVSIPSLFTSVAPMLERPIAGAVHPRVARDS